MMEDIHSEMYSLMIDTLIMDKEHKNRLFNAINTIPCIQKKSNYFVNGVIHLIMIYHVDLLLGDV